MPDPGAHLEGMTRILRILWGAFLAATVVYVVVAFVIIRGRGAGVPPYLELRPVRPIFWVAGALGLGIALLLRRRLLSRAFRDTDSALIGVQAALVVGWAATEAVAILGLVLVFLGGGIIDAVPFFLAAFVVVGGQRPTSEWLRRRIRAVEGGAGSGSIDP